MLVAAMNPCPCGYFGDTQRPCRCTPQQIQRYRNKISGPLLDRIDIHVEVPTVRYEELSSLQEGESSSIIRQRVIRAREVQQERFRKSAHVHSNAAMTAGDMQKHCRMNDDVHHLLKNAIQELNFSARAYNRILKVSRTIADLDGSELIEAPHISEAIQYRTLDRQLWA